jgi:hypothetical protein
MKIHKITPIYLKTSFIILTILTIQYAFLIISNIAVNKFIEWHIRPNQIPYNTQQIISEPTQQIVAKEYINQAIKAGWTMDYINRGWNVLYCESKFQYDAKNPKSTALGVAQYLPGTWYSVAPKGESRLNYKLSIALFIQNFPTNPKAWSECL